MEEKNFGEPGRIITGISSDTMLLPDPINDILRKARKKVEKRLAKSLKIHDIDDFIKYLYSYRILTKLLNREPLSIFDFWSENV